jgi:hypothetical protein
MANGTWLVLNDSDIDGEFEKGFWGIPPVILRRVRKWFGMLEMEISQFGK